MIYRNIKMALNSIKSSPVRSLLTMLGVIIGVASVVMIVSLGEGVKNQVISQINQLGGDVIVIRPGKLFDTNSSGKITRYNFNSIIGTSTLTATDIEVIKSVDGVTAVSSNSLITATAGSDENPDYSKALIIVSSPNTLDVLGQKLAFGESFTDQESTVNTVVIGSNIASDLFHQRDPIGRTVYIKGQEFTVRGVLADTPENPLNIGTNYNNIIYIPPESGKRLSGNQLQISELDVKVANGKSIQDVSKKIRTALLKSHLSQEDFTIINQQDYLNAANQVFNILTTFVAAIAGISLIVGGIGIMNIMLVSVSERTHEIGVRKAVGATNEQILSQFLIEAAVISVLGGILGVLLSLLAAFIIRVTTSIHPSISFSTILIATGISTVVGIIFGMTPAIKAADKDPIEALRHE